MREQGAGRRVLLPAPGSRLPDFHVPHLRLLQRHARRRRRPLGARGRTAARVRRVEGSPLGDLPEVLALEPRSDRRSAGTDRGAGARCGRRSRGRGDRARRPDPVAELRPGASREAAARRARDVALRRAAQSAAPRAAQIRCPGHGRRPGPRGRRERSGGRLVGRVRLEHAQLRADDVHGHHRPAPGESHGAADLRALRERAALAGQARGSRAGGAARAG